MTYDYDLLVIGLGPAGMAVSIMGSEMGLRVCAIESHKVGGECMNVGCIPSKALLRMAKARHAFLKLGLMELETAALPKVLNPFGRIEQDLSYISQKKTMSMFSKVDLKLGEGKAVFVDPHTVDVGGKRFTARRVFIAVGTRPEIPDFPGISEIDPLTNENMFHLDAIPPRLLVIGGGAIACEMAQAFSRLGSEVSILYRGARLLKREDVDASITLEKSFAAEGIKILHERLPRRFYRENGVIKVETDRAEVLEVDRVLVAAGRRMVLKDLGLEQAGVEYSEKGIKVNKHLQTTQPHIFAVGDCNGYYQFSHAAMHQGMLALINSMLPRVFRRNFQKYVVPWTIFTDPQISHVGPRESELKEKGVHYQAVSSAYEDYGAAIAEKVDVGFVKALVGPLGRVHAATVVGEGSADMINEWGLIVQKKLGMHNVLFLQHSFPSMAFLNKRVAETWMMKIMQGSSVMRRICQFMFRL